MPSKKYITILVVMAIISGLTVADWHHEQKKVDQLRGQNAELRQGIRKMKRRGCIQVESWESSPQHFIQMIPSAAVRMMASPRPGPRLAVRV